MNHSPKKSVGTTVSLVVSAILAVGVAFGALTIIDGSAGGVAAAQTNDGTASPDSLVDSAPLPPSGGFSTTEEWQEWWTTWGAWFIENHNSVEATTPETTTPETTTPETTTPETTTPETTPDDGDHVMVVTDPGDASDGGAAGDSVRWNNTIGSARSSAFEQGEPGAGSGHGVRVYCVVSHFSYDDPIVYPGQAGAAHAHMFWGNTGTDAFSDSSRLFNRDRSSCEGGTNNRSAYWTPSLFNEDMEVVLPEKIFVYYKSFGGDQFDRNTIQPIPNGLEMLATRNVKNGGGGDFSVARSNGDVKLTVKFPTCVKVDGSGNPVLKSADNISHLSYDDKSGGNNCPSSHPYRIPQLSYHLTYDVPFDSDWSLASDHSSAGHGGHGTAEKGSSLHGDYIAGWAPGLMDQVAKCNREEHDNCGFAGGRGQLEDRFLSPDGRRIYKNSIRVSDGADRTPFGTQIKPYSG